VLREGARLGVATPVTAVIVALLERESPAFGHEPRRRARRRDRNRFGARVVAPVFAETAGCKVVDVVRRATDAAVARLCSRGDVDLVSVHSLRSCTSRTSDRAIAAGHAVLCDKPFGRNAAEAQEMLDLARDAASSTS
jgi:predicted dehydrogenase